jgi:hypothetical protein
MSPWQSRTPTLSGCASISMHVVTSARRGATCVTLGERLMRHQHAEHMP